jgi:hypothetical protein
MAGDTSRIANTLGDALMSPETHGQDMQAEILRLLDEHQRLRKNKTSSERLRATSAALHGKLRELETSTPNPLLTHPTRTDS